MNRTLKRVLGLAGSAVLGLAGAVTFASAAQAHHVEFEGTAVCVDESTWTVTWEATDWEGKPADIGAGFIESYSVNAGELTGDLAVPNAVLPEFGASPITGVQTLSTDETSATLTLNAAWPNGQKNTGSSTVSQPEGGCAEEPEEPEPSYEYGGFYECTSVYAWGENYSEDALAEFTFVSSDGEEISGTPEVGDWIDYTFFVQDFEAGLSVDILVDGELVDTITWEPNELCAYISVENDCDSLTFTLSSPEDGEDAYFEVWTNLTEDEWTFDLAPGESETIDIPGQEGLQVYYYIETQKDAITGEVRWTPCPPETPSESPSPKPELPKTGSSLTIMVSSAAALIVAAGVIFFLMRRRRAAQDW
ncbi:LPXTG cell wall anchor domain-containing protein [Glycomyces albidus]|jgi:LPXTG-motif cell wall-anchored protein|uniref:LPXTG cell wall anchor domain-containing protein n=1 Tax=Glycomyces albidus TaxID=2656774 RepID=A0A6L5G3M5_9ACTN|nr:LPXTG cell wall anchor domain-containing protein [Glycomyces albidus]MQM24340.1 LPXTG cell wall anchor domain-containing protein [Glycomyces albidus]